jgi:hypothetical protein
MTKKLVPLTFDSDKKISDSCQRLAETPSHNFENKKLRQRPSRELKSIEEKSVMSQKVMQNHMK